MLFISFKMFLSNWLTGWKFQSADQVVEIIYFFNFRHLSICATVNFTRIFTNNPSHQVDIMNCAIMIDTTRYFQISQTWQRRISTNHFDLLNMTDFAYGTNICSYNGTLAMIILLKQNVSYLNVMLNQTSF